MIKYSVSWFKESYLFYFILLINLILISVVKFYPSMDGPAHLYNSNLIHQLTTTDSILNSFFKINPELVPNWLSHLIISSLMFVAPAWLAEKILLILYVIGLAISFRLLLNKLCPNNLMLSVFIFPFIYSFLFHLGFYNYSLSFIFLFLTIYYWLETREKNNASKYIVLFILFTAIYFSNLVSYFFLLLCLGSLIIYFSAIDFIRNRNLLSTFKYFIRKSFFLFLAALPSLILLLLFYKATVFFQTESHNPISTLVKHINDVRAIIVYDYSGEEIFTEQFFHIMLVIVSVSLFIRFKNKSLKDILSSLNTSDVFLFPIVVSLLFLFLIPNASGAGMMSDRFGLMFYMLTIVWVISQPIPKKLIYLIVLVVVVLHFGLLFKHLNGAIKRLNKDAIEIYQTSNYIQPNSIVLPVNLSENWVELHFSNYLGIDKPIVILENYEASVGWFPVLWNMEKIPSLVLGDKSSVNGIYWVSNKDSKEIKKIDYVLIFGNIERIDDPNWAELKETLARCYILTHTSDSKKVFLYRVNDFSK